MLRTLSMISSRRRRKVIPARRLVLIGALAAALAAPPARAGGVTSGGGVRSGDNVRLTDTLGPLTAGRTSSDAAVVEAGYITYVTEAVPVRLVSLTAGMEDAFVRLEWTMSEDSDPIGFHVERASSESGPFDRLTARPLPGTAREFVDERAIGAAAWYRLSAIARDGRNVLLGIVTPGPSALPERLRLLPPFPNPARSGATIAIDLPERTKLTLGVYDVSGRKVGALAEGWVEAGRHLVSWDASKVAAGVYFVMLETGTTVDRKKIALRH